MFMLLHLPTIQETHLFIHSLSPHIQKNKGWYSSDHRRGDCEGGGGGVKTTPLHLRPRPSHSVTHTHGHTNKQSWSISDSASDYRVSIFSLSPQIVALNINSTSFVGEQNVLDRSTMTQNELIILKKGLHIFCSQWQTKVFDLQTSGETCYLCQTFTAAVFTLGLFWGYFCLQSCL